MQPLNRPVVCPVFVGRDAHLAALDACLTSLAAGRGQTLLVSGEAGIGKSRLVAEARTRASGLGIVHLEGHCFESHRNVPYAPLIELLRAAMLQACREGRAAIQLDSLARLGSAELSRLLPELASTLPDAADSMQRAQAEPDRQQLFRGLTDAIHSLTDGRSALVVVEDAHWGDDASLDFIAYLAHQLQASPTLLLITYRDDEVSPALSKLLAGLDRRRLAAELRLTRLDRADVGAMVQAIFCLPPHPRPDFLEAVYSLTEGNPFFVEEVLRSLVAAGDIDSSGVSGPWSHRTAGRLQIPRSVRDAVQRRTATLGDDARHLLIVAAVAGQQFELELMAQVTDLHEGVLVDAVKELLAAGLIVDAGDDQFAFRHALTRAAVLDGLLTRERRSFHRRIADALERAEGSARDDRAARIADLAYHTAEASVWDRTLVYASQAGAHAQALYAPRAAIEHYTRALDAARALSMPAPMHLLRARGQAYETIGEFEAARTDFEAVLDQAQTAADRQAEWQALFDLGVAWLGRSYARGGEYLRLALELARQIESSDARPLGLTLNALGNLHTNLDEPEQAQRYHQEALATFRVLDDRRGLAESLDYLGMASFLAGDAIAACSQLQEAVTLFRSLDHRHGLASALGTWAIASGSGHLGDLMVLPEAVPSQPAQSAEAALRIAREIEWRAGEAYVLNCVASTHAATGNYGRALAAAREALDIANELEHREWIVYSHCTLGTLHLNLLALPEAQDHYDRATALAPATGSRYWLRLSNVLAALTRIEQGQLELAASLLERFLSLSRLPRTWAERSVHYGHARLALARGDAALALTLADELTVSDPNATTVRPARRALCVRGEALMALGRLEEAEPVLLTARQLAAEQAARPALWRIESRLAALYHRQGLRAAADAATAASRAIVTELADDVPDEALREAFLRRAADHLVPRHPLTPRRAAKQAAGGLTARERDVAVLVARGLTNREIADALILGERTVQTHVSNILGKLGFATRAQIAAWVAERGVLDNNDPPTDGITPSR
jgi:DNA-binding NarL/FixJ family response regulator